MNAIAVFQKLDIKDKSCSKVTGTIEFTQDSAFDLVHVKFNLKNLPPNSINAIHIHEYGDLRQNGTCCGQCGGHWNPYNKNHGSIWNRGQERHAGDLINNLRSDEFGNYQYAYHDPLLSLYGLDNIYGLSVVIHEGVDDLGLGDNEESLKNGNAGKRMACAVIGKCRYEPTH